MNRIFKQGMAALLALVLCLAMASGAAAPAEAASYVYNWGTRGEVATELSTAASDFYSGSNTYENFSQLSGSTSTGSVPSSELYKALQTFMVQKHTKQTSYQETRYMYCYTDCENGGGKISSFYSGKAIGPSWDSGSTWNREHTWPNSKGLGGNDENDIMMLRPTSVSENSSRGNTAYGESSGYYHPNSASNGKYDLRGDVARIMLYVYVRWGNTGKMWGSSGVMESVSVLLKWMEADPVDTWELGRNDSVQSITGTRNVFVDYPELAFILFGQEVPENMSTPSQLGDGGSSAGGDTSGDNTSGDNTSGDNTTDTSNGQVPAITSPETGKAYLFGMYQNNLGKTLYVTGEADGEYLGTTTDSAKAAKVYAETSGSGMKFYVLSGSSKSYMELYTNDSGKVKVGYGSTGSVFTYDAARSSWVTTYKSNEYYLGTFSTYETIGSSYSSYVTADNKGNDQFPAGFMAVYPEDTSGGDTSNDNTSNNNNSGNNTTDNNSGNNNTDNNSGNSNTDNNAGNNSGNDTPDSSGDNVTDTPDTPACTHANTERKGQVAASCSQDGYTGDLCCADCGERLEDGERIPAAHTLKRIAAVAPTLEADGTCEHYKCQICRRLFKDAEGQEQASLDYIRVERLKVDEEADNTLKIVLIVVLAVVLVGGGATVAVILVKQKKAQPAAPAE